jgi:hypothetical protein
MQPAIYEVKEPQPVQVATNLFAFLFNQHTQSSAVSLHAYKIQTHPKMERSNLMKHR